MRESTHTLTGNLKASVLISSKKSKPQDHAYSRLFPHVEIDLSLMGQLCLMDGLRGTVLERDVRHDTVCVCVRMDMCGREVNIN